MCSTRFVLFALVFLTTGVARATSELPAMFGARSVAMGGTGVAYLSDATATYSNPATLDGVKTFSAVLDASPFMTKNTSPLGADPAKESTTAVAPLFFAGGVYRLHERVVAGVAVYPTAGFGSTYEKVNLAPGVTPDMAISISILELAVPVSLRILDNLSVGVAWRGAYMMQSSKQPFATPLGPLAAEQSLSGFDAKGFEVGAAFAPIPSLKLGFAYRSKMEVSISGSTKVAAPTGELSLDTDSSFATPHSFRGGAALSLLDDSLMVAVDLRYLLFKDANESMKMSIDTTALTGSKTSTEQPLHWKNGMAVNVGVEYHLTSMLTGRVGYAYTQSATPADYASPFAVPPGVLHTFHIGAGVGLGAVTVDAGFFFALTSASATPVAASQAQAGTYKLTTMLGAVSASYSI